MPGGDQGLANATAPGMAGLVVVVWMLRLLLGSGPAWWPRLAVPAGIVAGAWLFLAFFSVEAVSGNIIPRFALRSSAAADARLGRPGGRGGDLSAATPDDFPPLAG